MRISNHQLLAIIFCFNICHCVKIKYLSEDDCDRYSLDALYHEKFGPITKNIFRDSSEFVSKASNAVSDSMSSVIAILPGRDSSDSKEQSIFTAFKNLGKKFSRKCEKLHKTITSSWEDLLANNHQLLLDHNDASLDTYLSKIKGLAGAYNQSRSSMDSVMAEVVGFIKNIVRNGLNGIIGLAKKEIQQMKNDSVAKQSEDVDMEEEVAKKAMEISEMVAPGFLGKVNVEILKNKIDLNKPVTIKSENRDSVFDDICFDVAMMRNRIAAIIGPDRPKKDAARNLARRSIYMHWTSLAEDMYKVRMQAKQKVTSSDDYYIKLWSDEEKLADTLVNLMEVYP